MCWPLFLDSHFRFRITRRQLGRVWDSAVSRDGKRTPQIDQ